MSTPSITSMNCNPIIVPSWAGPINQDSAAEADTPLEQDSKSGAEILHPLPPSSSAAVSPTQPRRVGDTDAYERIRLVGKFRALNDCPMVLMSGRNLRIEAENLHARYLHENDLDVAFLGRRGAFSYNEVYFSCINKLVKPWKDFCETCTHLKARFFLMRNIELLQRELDQSKNTNKEQICTFRLLLIDFAYLRQMFKMEEKFDTLQEVNILTSLEELENELPEFSRAVQQRILDLEPMMIHLGKKEAESSHKIALRYLDGSLCPFEENEAFTKEDYKQVHEFFSNYLFLSLGSNVIYCRKFMQSIRDFKDEVSSFINTPNAT